MIRQFFKYFNLSRTEQNGFFVLCTLILLLFSFPYIIKFFSNSDFDHYNIQAFKQVGKDQNSTVLPKEQGEFRNKERTASKATGILFHFDPNHLDASGWIKLGLTQKQLKVILNYREKGGKFYKKEDLAKIYSISPTDFKRLADYIVIEPVVILPENSSRLRNQSAPTVKYEIRKVNTGSVDINQADTAQLLTLIGIGPTFAKRIIKYRESLGGFVSVQQIKEIYGLPMETFEQILPFLKIDPQATISKILINNWDVKLLSKHPYISFKQSTAIVNYRIQHGDFKSLEDLQKVILLDDDFIYKIAPYLTF